MIMEGVTKTFKKMSTLRSQEIVKLIHTYIYILSSDGKMPMWMT